MYKNWGGKNRKILLKFCFSLFISYELNVKLLLYIDRNLSSIPSIGGWSEQGKNQFNFVHIWISAPFYPFLNFHLSSNVVIF